MLTIFDSYHNSIHLRRLLHVCFEDITTSAIANSFGFEDIFLVRQPIKLGTNEIGLHYYIFKT